MQIAFGVIGLFIGPVVLAVTYTLVSAWIEDQERAALPELLSADRVFREPAPSVSRPGKKLDE